MRVISWRVSVARVGFLDWTGTGGYSSMSVDGGGLRSLLCVVGMVACSCWMIVLENRWTA
jgi:hypothetical protein